MTVTQDSVSNAKKPLYYDPYDFDIDKNPYPIWRRMREEQPLYYNEKYDFYALSRYDDVEACSKDWRRYSSAKGTLLELIRTNMEIPPGSIIFEDPPTHDLYRGIVAPIFSPRNMAKLDAKVRDFCASCLDPLVGKGGFDFIADIGAMVPMRTIGMLLGIPEEDQVALRDQIDKGLTIEKGEPPPPDMHNRLIAGQLGAFGEYVEWRSKNPSDDVISQILAAEFEDHTGTKRKLRREEVIGFVNLIGAAGNETTARLIGFAGKVLGSTRTSAARWPRTSAWFRARSKSSCATSRRRRCRRAT